MVSLLIFGCTFFKKAPPQQTDQPVEIYESDGRYYYYIESQLLQKKGQLDQAIDFLKSASASSTFPV